MNDDFEWFLVFDARDLFQELVNGQKLTLRPTLKKHGLTCKTLKSILRKPRLWLSSRDRHLRERSAFF